MMTGREQTWEAGWVQALAGSNPASSASPKTMVMTWGNAPWTRGCMREVGLGAGFEACAICLSSRPR
jgi:hypothetical protein